MWQRFTERARRVVFFAQEDAGKRGENHVKPENLLMGLVRESDTVAARILDRMGISLQKIREEIEREAVQGSEKPSQEMQLTPGAKMVIDLAYDESRRLVNAYIGTEHLLLGLIRQEDSLASRILARLGADLERARQEVIALQDKSDLSGAGRNQEPADALPVSEERDLSAIFDSLEEEQKARLAFEGILYGELPEDFQKNLQAMVQFKEAEKSFTIDRYAPVKVFVVPVGGKRQFTITFSGLILRHLE